jgi:N4-gp56 family major capsid protein
MTALSTATSGFSDLMQEMVAAQIEEELRGRMVWAQPGNGFLTGRFDKGTNTIRYQRYADIAVDSGTTGQLTQGTPPTAVALTIESEAFSATQYGKLVEITDLAALQSPADLPAVAAERVGNHAARTIDSIVKDVVLAGTNVVYANGSARTALHTGISASLIRTLRAKMVKAGIPTFGDGTWHLILTPEQVIALQAETGVGGWIDVAKYSSPVQLLTGEAGRLMGFRVIDANKYGEVSSQGGSASADVHIGFAFGPQAWVQADMQSLSTHYVAPGGGSDPLAQRMYVGWKWTGGAMLISETGERAYRVESAETTL